MKLAQFDLTGKVALVTGGTKGIGRALSLGLASAGADVVVVSRHQDQCGAVAEEVRSLGQRGLGIAADVSSVTDAERVVSETVRTLGGLHVLVNNAGVNSVQAANMVREDDWNKVIEINLKAVFFWSQAAAKEMITAGKGKIINISSVGGVIGESKMAAYAASKAGVISLTKSLAREWGRYNIQVNGLGPGYVLTEMNEEALKDEKVFNSIVSTIPLRRIGKVDDLIGPAVFLASTASDFVTGHTLFVDGGRLTGAKG